MVHSYTVQTRTLTERKKLNTALPAQFFLVKHWGFVASSLLSPSLMVFSRCPGTQSPQNSSVKLGALKHQKNRQQDDAHFNSTETANCGQELPPCKR